MDNRHTGLADPLELFDPKTNKTELRHEQHLNKQYWFLLLYTNSFRKLSNVPNFITIYMTKSMHS